MPPADHHVTLLTRAGCHLCDEARRVVSQVAADLGSPWEERDIDGDSRLQAEYGELVPVVLIDGREHGYWRVEEPRLRRVLSR